MSDDWRGGPGMRRTIDDGDEDLRAGGRVEQAGALDMLGRRIGGAIVLAGALIGLGIYWSADTTEAPTYQAFAADGEVFRVNTDSGSIIACNATRCTQILRRGQDLAEDQGNTLFRVPPAAQLPAPAPQQPAPATAPVGQQPAAQPK